MPALRLPSPSGALRTSILALLAATAAAYLASTLAVVVNFGLRYPAWDQFRLYRFYLGLPFPENAVQLENGHRPILPALVRLAEIQWFHADQILQLVVGLGAALLATALVVLAVLREHKVPPLSRAAGVLLAVMAVFWLGNARMLVHGNELVHAYFVVLFTVLALLATIAARGRHETPWMVAAASGCLAATFSFGTGMASFGAVIVIAVVTRRRARSYGIIAAFLAVAAAAYLGGLPGDGGVRHSLLFDPGENLLVITRWLAAPWMRAWFGHADPPLEAWLQASMGGTAIGSALVASARWLASPLGADPAMRIGSLLGVLGLFGYMAALVHAWRAAKQPGTARLLGLGLATFGFGAAVIVCFARLRYFQAVPEQVFADRYLPWSCLFWLGLALYAVLREAPSSPARGLPAAGLAMLVAVLLAPSQRSLAGWSATVHRHNQQSAVAAQLGIWDPKRFESSAASNQDAEETLRLLREQRLSMFAEPAYARLAEHWRATLPLPAPLEGTRARFNGGFTDPHGGRIVMTFEGRLPRLAGLARDPFLPVVDADGHLRGLAKISFIGPGKKSLRFTPARQRGFDGYVMDASPGEDLSILVFDAAGAAAGLIPLAVPRTDEGK